MERNTVVAMYESSADLANELKLLSGWEFDQVQGYSLGYLMRKLQGNEVQIYEQVGERWTCLIGEGDYATNGDTPEDAAARLAVELFKQGILHRED